MTNNEQNWHLNFFKHISLSSNFPAPLNNRGQTSLCGQKLVWRYSLLPLATHIHEQEKWLLLWAKTCCCWKCCWHQMELLCWKNNNILVLPRRFEENFIPYLENHYLDENVLFCGLKKELVFIQTEPLGTLEEEVLCLSNCWKQFLWSVGGQILAMLVTSNFANCLVFILFCGLLFILQT